MFGEVICELLQMPAGGSSVGGPNIKFLQTVLTANTKPLQTVAAANQYLDCHQQPMHV
jgi:hypothetical protein